MQTSKPPVSQGTAAFISPLTDFRSEKKENLFTLQEKKGIFVSNCKFQVGRLKKKVAGGASAPPVGASKTI